MSCAERYSMIVQLLQDRDIRALSPEELTGVIQVAASRLDPELIQRNIFLLKRLKESREVTHG